MTKPLAENDALVLSFIRAHPAVTDANIALDLNMNLADVQTALYKLVKRRLITFNPADDPQRYLPR
jgi:transcription initiation factor IIE alpha subunit